MLLIGILLFLLSSHFLCGANNNLSLNWTTKIPFPDDYLKKSNYTRNMYQLVPHKYNGAIFMNQINSNDPKDFPWKQTGIYGFELLGAGLGSTYCAAVFAYGVATTGNAKEGTYGYIIANSLITSTCCWGSAWLIKQEGSWRKSIIGAGLGSIIPAIYWINAPSEADSPIWDEIFGYSSIALPTIGAVIGYNF